MDVNVVGIAVLGGFALGLAIIGTRLLGVVQSIVFRPIEERLEKLLKPRLTPKSSESLDAKLERVGILSGELASLNSAISTDFKRSLTETARLQKEAETAKNVASLNEDQAKAVVAMLKQGEGSNRWFQVFVSFVFFIAGVLTTMFLPGFLNWIFPTS